jgi:hypothetical protein
MVLQLPKCAGEFLSSFSFKDEYTRGFKCPHKYKYMGLKSTGCWAVTFWAVTRKISVSFV